MTSEMMTTGAAALTFTKDQQWMIRSAYANGASDDEFAVLMEIARARRLNPLLRQIHFVKRWTPRGDVWSVQVSIDGLRAIAERTGLYAGQDEPEFTEKPDGSLLLCKVRVYRRDWGGRPAVGVAYWDEYVQTTKDKQSGKTRPNEMWGRMRHTMLAKCAEALALRKAFPEDMSGLYTGDEMGQADNGREDAVEFVDASAEQKPPPALPANIDGWLRDLAAVGRVRELRAAWATHAAAHAEGGTSGVDDVRAWLRARGLCAAADEARAVLSTLDEALCAALELAALEPGEDPAPTPDSDALVRAARAARAVEAHEYSVKVAWAILARSYGVAKGLPLRDAATELKAACEQPDPDAPPTGTDPARGREPGEDDGADPAGFDAARAAGAVAQASATAWRETAEGITAHVAAKGAMLALENSGRLHLREISEALVEHAERSYATRMERLSFDGQSSTPADECRATVARWRREGPRIARLPAKSAHPAAKIAAGGGR